jgi:hypothetical protein
LCRQLTAHDHMKEYVVLLAIYEALVVTATRHEVNRAQIEKASVVAAGVERLVELSVALVKSALFSIVHLLM